MQPTRRFVLAASAGALSTAAWLSPAALRPAFGQAAAGAAADPRMAPRAFGDVHAKANVEEWFSFTCPHCAAFARDVYPDVRAKLIDTGKLRYVFREFPRDRTDLMAAMVARGLPASRYEPFVLALLAAQKQWAFTEGVDPKEELAKMAALAGMPRDVFDRTVDDQALQASLLAAQSEAEKKYSLDSTPTFIVNGTSHPGEMSYAEFAKLAEG